MKLVLLPGMDGTGMLFDRLIALLPLDCQIIVLPKGADQSYTYLTEYCIGRLPREDFVLLAESFSGPIAARIASDRRPNLKAVIFVATFLQPPSPPLLKLARLISPLTLLHLGYSSILYWRCLSDGAIFSSAKRCRSRSIRGAANRSGGFAGKRNYWLQ